jgi:hypothetical protein
VDHRHQHGASRSGLTRQRAQPSGPGPPSRSRSMICAALVRPRTNHRTFADRPSFISRGSGIRIPSAPPETTGQNHDHHRGNHDLRSFDRHSTVAQAVSDRSWTSSEELASAQYGVRLRPSDPSGHRAPRSRRPCRSQGPRLSDLLEVEVHKDPTHHWAEARSPVANRASAALLVATHIARERQQRRRADAQDVLTWAADATPAISPSAGQNGGSCESGDLPSKHPQPIRRTVGGRSARQRPRTRRRLRPAGQTGTSWHLRGYRRWLIDRDVTHGTHAAARIPTKP